MCHVALKKPRREGQVGLRRALEEVGAVHVHDRELAIVLPLRLHPGLRHYERLLPLLLDALVLRVVQVDLRRVLLGKQQGRGGKEA